MKQRKIMLPAGIFLLVLFAFTILARPLPVSAGATKSSSEAPTEVSKAPQRQGRWVKKRGGYKFKHPSGRYAGPGWLVIKDKTYRLDKDGYRITGWHTYRRNRYYFRRSGTMVSQQWLCYKGRYYYLRKNGKMAKGWISLQGRKYYLDSDGTRVTGAQYIKGKGYYFDRKGRYVPGRKVTGRVINPRKKMIALTFDDGPGPYTRRLLRCLKKTRSAATFFVVGTQVKKYPDVVARATQIGCEIGNHTWDHPSLDKLAPGAIDNQIRRTDQAVKTATGKKPTILRPPYGAYNTTVANNVGKPMILWSIDTRDWQTRNTNQTIQTATTGIRDGDIILMHDIHLPTIKAAETIIPRLIKKGYQLVTVSELAKHKKIKMRKGKVYSSLKK